MKFADVHNVTLWKVLILSFSFLPPIACVHAFLLFCKVDELATNGFVLRLRRIARDNSDERHAADPHSSCIPVATMPFRKGVKRWKWKGCECQQNGQSCSWGGVPPWRAHAVGFQVTAGILPCRIRVTLACDSKAIQISVGERDSGDFAGIMLFVLCFWTSEEWHRRDVSAGFHVSYTAVDARAARWTKRRSSASEY